ncbi:MAG: histidine phosphatase family protein [Lentisphaerae bacterium]|nr:histidine phosphatase family protein [Lentisphaerota bacterium]
MSSPTRTVWLIRHGHRLDFVDPDWMATAARPLDSPLSKDGEQQATETGKKLQPEQINLVYASPFLRTVQTASLIAMELALPIRIEAGLAEMFLEQWFPHNPDLPTADVLRKQFPGIDAHYNSTVIPTYPETEDNATIRMANAVESIIRNSEGNLALITHGGSISRFCRKIAPNKTVYPTFCCLIELKWSDGVWTIKLDGSDNSHLTQNKTDLRFF